MARDVTPSKSFSRGRKWLAGLNAFVAVVSLMAVVVMVNYIATRHYWRGSVGGDGRFNLSAMTLRVLQSITNRVEVTLVFDPDPRDGVYSAVSGLLDEYHHINPKIVVDRVDRVRNLSGVEVVLAKYDIPNRGNRDLIIFSSGTQHEVVLASELSEYDVDTGKALAVAASGGTNEFRRKSFRGEMLFTTALFNVTDPREDKAYFLEGHGEHGLSATGAKEGYSSFVGLLADKSVKSERLKLSGTNAIPSDCKLLIVSGPTTALDDREVEMLSQYLDHGGRLLLLFNFLSVVQGHTPQNGLEQLLAKWGVQAGNNLVADTENSIKGSGFEIAAQDFGVHPIVKPLLGQRVYLAASRSVSRRTNGNQGADSAQVTELIFTSAKGLTCSKILNGKPVPDPKVDRVGKKSLAVAVEKGAIQGISDSRGSTRMVIMGDSFCFADGVLENASNRELASLAIYWLLDRKQMLGGMEPRPVSEYKLLLSDKQMFQLRLLLLAGMPGAVLLPGLLVWLRRRK